MTKLLSLPGVALFLFVLHPALAVAQNATADLRNRLESMNSFSANFTQTLYDEADKQLQQSEGVAKLKRPGQLFWETTSPYENLMIANNETLWRYDIDLEQVTRQPLDKDLSETPALLLSGEVGNIDKNFSVSSKKGRAGETTFVLKPRSANSLMRELSLTFTVDAITAMRIVDDLQQRTDIKFSDVVVNAPIDASVFEFKVPAGIDLLTNE